MIMGYAGRIAANEATTDKVREQAEIVRKQSVKIKELVQDLNLVSQLEYEMHAITACFERYSRRLLEQSKSSRIPIREQLKKAAEQLVKEPPKTQERTKEVVREER